MIVLRLTVAVVSALILADCGGMHACTSDGVPCGESPSRTVASSQSSGGARPTPPPALPAPTVTAANAPFVPPAAFEAPAPAAEPAPAPAAEPGPVAHTATVTETTVASVEEEEGSGRHGRHRRHRGRHHRSGSSRHHRRHR